MAWFGCGSCPVIFGDIDTIFVVVLIVGVTDRLAVLIVVVFVTVPRSLYNHCM